MILTNVYYFGKFNLSYSLQQRYGSKRQPHMKHYAKIKTNIVELITTMHTRNIILISALS